MARRHNYLLGRGEALTFPVTVNRKPTEKNPPYDFPAAQKRLARKLNVAVRSFGSLPPPACPGGEVVGVVTMHPRYIAKSDFPSQLFETVGLRTVGSRLKLIAPDNWGVQKPPDAALAQDVFVAAPRQVFQRWGENLPRWTGEEQGALAIQRIEDIFAFRAPEKIRRVPFGESVTHLYEIVLHNGSDERVVIAFIDYARSLRAEILVDKRKDARGLTFLPVRAEPATIRELADFTYVRVARPMPRLRSLQPSILRLVSANTVNLPGQPAIDPDTRVAMFDGGIPKEIDLSRWVRLIEPDGIGKPDPGYEEHGLAVTSALLFGSLRDGVTPRTPLCSVDHVRVLDNNNADPGLEYVEVLDRIVTFMDAHKGEHEFYLLCVGPRMAIDDEDVTQWTALLDERLANDTTLAAVAAGNDGEWTPVGGHNRVQPPADGVNVLSVGACTSEGDIWCRASYSCVGPGRTPGVVKPDGVAFGGSENEPYAVLATGLRRQGHSGTSLAAPHALRSALAIRAQLGMALSPLTIRALLVHSAEAGSGDDAPSRHEVGWGRFSANYDELITCEDDEALIIYQGLLPVGQHLRAPIPFPPGPIPGRVEITATLLIAPKVNPEHAGAYTRSGVLPTFRPHSGRFGVSDGRRSHHPKSEAFFSLRNMYAAAEFEFREDGQKWEPCIRASRRKNGALLLEPVFDIQYNHREGMVSATEPESIPYALVIGMRTPRVIDLYNRVVREYANVLVPIRPRLRIPVRT
jgi:hypothetical protein